MLVEPAGATPSTTSLVQPVVPTGSHVDETPPSHLSLMSNQLSAIWVVPVAALPRAQTSPRHFWPALTGSTGETRYEGEPAVKNWDIVNSRLRIWPALGPDGRYFNRTIDTDGKYYATYGYFECRAKLCKGYGTWPAFWVFNHIGNDRPELDVMEAYCGGERAGNGGWSNLNDEPLSYTATIHRTEGDKLYDVNSWSDGFGAIRLDKDFHKYGMHWDATGVQFYFDDQPLGDRFESPHFTRPMYIMLDLWYGSASGDPNNPPGGTGFAPTGPGNSYEIDYVAHWPLLGDEPTENPNPDNTFTNAQFWGESTVYGYKSGVGGQVAQTMVEQFATHFTETFVENKGVNSVSSKEMLEGSGDMAPHGGWEDNMAASNATHVFIQVGINDAADSRPKGDYQYYLHWMATHAKNAGKTVIFLTPNPTTTMNLGTYRDWMVEAAQAVGAHVIDVYQFFLNYAQVNGVSVASLLPDGIHPSDAMYIAIGNYVAQEWTTIMGA